MVPDNRMAKIIFKGTMVENLQALLKEYFFFFWWGGGVTKA
jgi:hypothetical protein